MKKIHLLIVVALLAALVLSPSAVSAQKFTAYVTGTQVMNLSATSASIVMVYYNVDDGSGTAGQQADSVNDTIGGNSSKTYFPAVTPFKGSVVLSSTAPVGAVVNVQNSTATAMAAYVGASQGATTVNLPLLMKGNGSVPYDTWFSVQNTGGTDAHISIKYSDVATPVTAAIKPNASKNFTQSTETHPSKVFSGVITSDQPIVVVVLQENTAKMLAYTGFNPDAAATNTVFPLVNINNNGILTGIQIQNTTATSTSVTVSYTPSLAGTACTETQTIDGNSSKTFALLAFAVANPAGITTNCAPGVKFVGSARVTGNTASVALVGIVNQSKSEYAEAYGAFNPANATPKVVMPLLMDRNGSNLYSTGFSVMNVGGASTWVKCTLTGAAAAAYTPSGQLAAGAALTPNQASAIGVKYVGSGQCTAYTDSTYATVDNAAKLVAIVNEKGITSPAADRFLVYEGINVAP
jgi:hypothetical protein